MFVAELRQAGREVDGHDEVRSEEAHRARQLLGRVARGVQTPQLVAQGAERRRDLIDEQLADADQGAARLRPTFEALELQPVEAGEERVADDRPVPRAQVEQIGPEAQLQPPRRQVGAPVAAHQVQAKEPGVAIPHDDLARPSVREGRVEEIALPDSEHEHARRVETGELALDGQRARVPMKHVEQPTCSVEDDVVTVDREAQARGQLGVPPLERTQVRLESLRRIGVRRRTARDGGRHGASVARAYSPVRSGPSA